MVTARRLLWVITATLLLAACERASDSEDSSGGVVSEQLAADSEQSDAAPYVLPDMDVLSETVVYAEIAGRAVSGYLAYPADAHGALPAVLMFHEWWGLNEDIKTMADRLAGQGYLVLAVDLYGGEVATDPENAQNLMRAALADEQSLDANITQAHKFLHDQTQAVAIATLGWSLGGTMSLRAASKLPQNVDLAVIYYGTVADFSEEQLARLSMPVLGIFGGRDQSIPAAEVEQFRGRMNTLGKHAEIHIYEAAGHAFANPAGTNYQAEAAEDAWDKTLEFLDRYLNAGLYSIPTG